MTRNPQHSEAVHNVAHSLAKREGNMHGRKVPAAEKSVLRHTGGRTQHVIMQKKCGRNERDLRLTRGRS